MLELSCKLITVHVTYRRHGDSRDTLTSLVVALVEDSFMDDLHVPQSPQVFSTPFCRSFESAWIHFPLLRKPLALLFQEAQMLP